MHKSQWTEHGGKKPHSKLWEVVLCQEKKSTCQEYRQLLGNFKK